VVLYTESKDFDHTIKMERMMKILKKNKAFMLFIGTYLAVLFLFPQSVYAVVGGVEIVAGQEGQPNPETTISIFQNGELIKEEKTDNNGMALIPLEEGDYKIVLKSADKAIDSNITVEPGKLQSLTGNFAKGVISMNKFPLGRYRPINATSVQKGFSVSSADLDGLMSYNLSTPQGSIYCGFPYHTQPGETISWNALLLGAGYTTDDTKKNMKKLQDYQLQVGDEIHSLKGTTRWTSPATPKIDIALLSKNGKKTLIKLTINLRFQAAPSPNGALVSTAGWPVCIPGRFDGDAANTQAQFGGHPIEVRAETSSSVIINPPQKLLGLHPVIITDGGVTTEAQVINASLELFADKTQLFRGEGTQVHLNINGLGTVQRLAVVQLYNLSTSIVTMSGGNSQIFIIDPTAAGPGGTISFIRNLTGIRRGDFEIIAILHTW
jgi:hypothetical protein